MNAQQNGDTFKRNFTGDVAQCGCRWIRGPITLPDGSVVGFGDVLHECPIHQAAGAVLLERFKREAAEAGKCAVCCCRPAQTSSAGRAVCEACFLREQL